MVEPLQQGKPWTHIEALIAADDAAGLELFLRELDAADTVHALGRLDVESQARVLGMLPPPVAAQLTEHLSDEHAADLIEELPAASAAAIVDQLDSDDQVDVLAEMADADAQAILDQMDPADARDARQRLAYDPESAGGLMIDEFLHYHRDQTIDDVIHDMRDHAEAYAEYDVQYAYVTDDDDRLTGVIRLRDLLMTPGSRPLTAVMTEQSHSVPVDAELNTLNAFFGDHKFYACPVIDMAERLVGVVRRAAVEQALGERADRTLLRLSGIITGDELRSMPLAGRSMRRLAFLTPNILLNLIAVSVIALYEPILAQITTLMVFLPILSDMSGCSGNQAVAVSMRELSLGLIRPADVWRTLAKEISIGVINGIVLGLLLGVIAWLYKDNLVFGGVVGAALALNSMVAVCLGGAAPLVFKGIKIDPALASGPILTTITDLCGFFFALTFASALLPHLTAAA